MPDGNTAARKRLLIEDWLPAAAIGVECLRERTPLTPFPGPNRLHVWWARRPLAACRAVLFAQLVDDPSSHPDKFSGRGVTAKRT